ncbi:MAG: DEAD/DEAH box helicase [Planctomycetes bacterium]|nr:DEAD/DEAH box helicase [Planctomycetota bacterium]
MQYKGFQLDPFQEQAIRAISEGRSVIVAAPTGAGKTLVAEYALEQCLREGRRAVYTAPIKALSNQKFRDFGRTYGGKIGILTGDVSLNPEAPVVIMTTEIFRNTIFENPARLSGLAYAIFDEIHFLDDPERGTVWEESIIFAPPDVRFVFLSATVSNLDELAAWISEVRREPLEVVREEGRPVPLHHRLFIRGKGVGDFRDLQAAAAEAERRNRGRPLRRPRGPAPRRPEDRGPDVVRALVDAGDLPAIVFSFRRADCEEKAERAARLDLVSFEEGKALAADFDALARIFDIGDDPGARAMRRLAARGVAFHHAGLLPTLKEVVERLFTDGRIRLLFATDTFALGVNMPAKAVVLSALRKFDGERVSWLLSREYQQMAGRAGRRGIDTEGRVLAFVDPEEDRIEGVRRVVTGRPEDVNSRFSLSYAALLALFGRLGEDRLFEACERSFAAFRRRARGGPAFREMMAQVRARLEFLRKIGYLEGGEVTPVGRRAALLYGYELQVAELWRNGVFHALDAPRLAALFAALVFEEKPNHEYRYLPRRAWGPVLKRVRNTVHALIAGERRSGVREPLKLPGFGIAAAAHAWALGADFRELEKWISASDGDVVRSLRMANQLLRQAERAFHDDDHLVPLLRDARRRIDRDEVDAERQLRQGAGLVEGEEETTGGEGREKRE